MDGSRETFRPFLHDVSTEEAKAAPDTADLMEIQGALISAELMEGVEEVPVGTKTPPQAEENDLWEQECYSTIRLPPGLFDADLARFVMAIVRSVQRMEPAATPMHRAIYRILARLADSGTSKFTPNALVLGVLLAAAKLHNIQIRTHARDLAKEAGVRASTLYKIRRAAIIELAAL